MQLSKQASIGLIALAVVVVGALGWFLFLRSGGGSLGAAEQAKRDATMKAAQQNMQRNMMMRGRPGGPGGSGGPGGYPAGGYPMGGYPMGGVPMGGGPGGYPRP